ncbi:MAG TPA: hypothetical protein VLC53_01155, partial [Myxococcota bacterium]|nr:hypothetical protein [Myxococcota bacterium]
MPVRRLPRAGLTVALQRRMFTLDPGQLGAGRGERTRRRVALLGEPLLARLGFLEVGAQADGLLTRGFGHLLRFGHGFVRIAVPPKRSTRLVLPPQLAGNPLEPVARLRHFGLGDAPFGLDPRVVRGRLGKRQFGRAAGALGFLDIGGNCRAPLLVGSECLLASFEVGLQLVHRRRGIAGQAVGLDAVLLEPRLLPVEVGKALLGRFELAGERRHPVAVRAGVVAPVGQLVARLG